MANENDDIQLPKQPEWALTTALKSGLLWTGIGAAMGAVFSQIPGLNKIYHRGAVAEALESGSIGAIIGVVIGYVTGARRQAEYPHKVENAVLRYSLDQKNEALAEKSEEQRSHMAKINAQRSETDKECGKCNLRS